MKKLGLFVMALATLCFMGCEDKTKVTKITLPEAPTVQVGKTLQLKAVTTPAGQNSLIVWTSDNETVATVKSGKVTGVTIGEATITATIGEVEATCVVTVTDPNYDLNIVSYGFFGLSDAIPGSDTTFNFGTKEEPNIIKCVMKYTERAYAWDENVSYDNKNYQFIGEGYICGFDSIPVYVIVEGADSGKYLNAGGFNAMPLAKGKVVPYCANVKTLSIENLGKHLSMFYDYDADTTGMYHAISDFKAANSGAFIAKNVLMIDEKTSEEYYQTNIYYGFYNAHINQFAYREADEYEGTDQMFAADVTWGNLDGTQYLYGFETDSALWAGSHKIKILTPYADHYKTIRKTYDVNGLWSTQSAPKYSIADQSKFHAELPKNVVVNDKVTLHKK